MKKLYNDLKCIDYMLLRSRTKNSSTNSLRLFFTCMAVFVLISLSSFHCPVHLSMTVNGSHVATCYGSINCRACKTCNYCAHCNAGGSCGVCSSGTSQQILRTRLVKTKSSTASSQCQGITKKGNRCKRMVRGGGYCWQHAA